MMTPTDASLIDRADFYRVLSRAVMPPTEPLRHQLFVEELPNLMEEFDAALSLGAAADCAAFRASLAAVPAPIDLLVVYSGLFLSPPVPAPINAGLYLDGAMMGGSLDAIEQAFAARGLGKSDEFRDMPDHLAVLAEFVGHLFELAAAGDPAAATGAAGFLRRFVHPWLGDCAERVARSADDAPYLHLLRLARRAVERDAAGAAETAPPRRRKTRPEALLGGPGRAVACSRCGTAFMREKQLAKLARMLQAQNLATDHLDVCPDCRTAAMGFTRMKPPSVGRKRAAALG